MLSLGVSRFFAAFSPFSSGGPAGDEMSNPAKILQEKSSFNYCPLLREQVKGQMEMVHGNLLRSYRRLSDDWSENFIVKIPKIQKNYNPFILSVFLFFPPCAITCYNKWNYFELFFFLGEVGRRVGVATAVNCALAPYWYFIFQINQQTGKWKQEAARPGWLLMIWWCGCAMT